MTKTKANISVERIDEPGCRCALKFGFDPEELGSERTKMVWEGVALIVKGVLDESEVDEFLTEFRKAAEARGTRQRQESTPDLPRVKRQGRKVL